MRELKIIERITSRDSKAMEILFRDINKYEVPSLKEEEDLAFRIRQGDTDALDELVVRNLRFVVSVAKSYVGRGMEVIDLFSEGCIGLIKAAQRFDPTMGYKFCSYAVWWIRQSMLKAMDDNGATIRMPSNMRSIINKVSQARSEYMLQYEMEPTPEQIAELADIDIEKVESIDLAGRCTSSLDAPIADDDGSRLVDMIAAEEANDRYLDMDALKRDLMKVVDTLDKRAQTIIIMKFGLDGNGERSLDEIAATLDLTKERVRQIQNKAYRAMSRNDLLKTYAA